MSSIAIWLRFHSMKAILHVLAPIVIADVRGVRDLAGEGAYQRSDPADR
jgi:acid phosphatase family membrane protein YuiD